MCVCYQAPSYAICLNVERNVPMDRKRCFLNFLFVDFATNLSFKSYGMTYNSDHLLGF